MNKTRNTYIVVGDIKEGAVVKIFHFLHHGDPLQITAVEIVHLTKVEKNKKVPKRHWIKDMKKIVDIYIDEKPHGEVEFSINVSGRGYSKTEAWQLSIALDDAVSIINGLEKHGLNYAEDQLSSQVPQ